MAEMISQWGRSLFSSWSSRVHQSLASKRSVGLKDVATATLIGDKDTAQELYRGHFNFCDKQVVSALEEVFEQQVSHHWREELLSFEWLRHLAASNMELHRAFAQRAVLCWLHSNHHQRFSTKEIHLIVRRLNALNQHASFLLKGSWPSFQQDFIKYILRSASWLAAHMRGSAAQLCAQAISLTNIGLHFHAAESFQAIGLAKLCTQLPRTILADGGHISRNPQELLSLIGEELLPLQETLHLQHIAVPQALHSAIERAFPMLRMMCHGDHGLALFQGAKEPAIGMLKDILGRDLVAGRPLSFAPHSGYARLHHGGSTLLVDIGKPAQEDSHLAFEFSCGPHRIFSNCGPILPQTLIAESHTNMLTLLQNDQRIDRTSYEKGERDYPAVSALGTVLTATRCFHRLPGFKHKRTLFLNANGLDLRGEESLSSSRQSQEDIMFVVHFHLHPAVKISASQHKQSLLLILPNRLAWRFSVRGGALSLEESMFVASPTGPRKSCQIVIRGKISENRQINWALQAVKKAILSPKKRHQDPQLPLDYKTAEEKYDSED